MSLNLLTVRSRIVKRPQVEVPATVSSNARKNMLAAVAVATEHTVHGERIGEDGSSGGGNRGNGQQRGEDDGLHESTPGFEVCVAVRLVGQGRGVNQRFRRLLCRREDAI